MLAAAAAAVVMISLERHLLIASEKFHLIKLNADELM